MSPPEDNKPSQPVGSSALAGLFRLIVKAIQDGHSISETQHLRQIQRYSEQVGDEVVPLGEASPPDKTGKQRPRPSLPAHMRPKTLTLTIDMPGDERREVEVPLLALSPPTSLALKELQMEFQVQLVGVDDEADEVEVKIGEAEAELEAAMARVKVTVEGTEPPDSVSRIIELLTQQMI